VAALSSPSAQSAARASNLGRGLEILLALGSDESMASGGLGVIRVAELVGREKSQVSRALKTLAELGLVDREPDSLNYRLGWRVFTMAARAGDARLVDAAPAVLTSLVAALGETAHLTVLDGTQVLTLLSEQSPAAVRASGWSGRTVPAYCTSSGRALLFDHAPGELRERFGTGELPARGSCAPRDVGELHRRIVAARVHGFAVVDQEYERGLVGVAAPVRDFRGRIIAAVNVSAPKFRFGAQLEAVGGPRVKAAAAELSRQLGWTPHRAVRTGDDDD
jgi:DNA-binding IclR family transcriptional regulator